MSTDNKAASTAPEQRKRVIGKPFPKGVSGNPKGRPMGSRQRLSESFIDILSADFQRHGEHTIVALRETKPEVYVRVVADLVPKDLNVNMDASQAFVEMLKVVSGER